MRSEDGYFIGKCINGDPAAFGFLVDKYKACVYALAYTRLRNFHDAEDATQEVFLTAYNKLRTLRRYDNFRAWLYSITSNYCKMHFRSKAKSPDNEFIEDNPSSILDGHSIELQRESLADEINKELIEMLDEALESLPEMYHQVITLRYLGGMNNDEIAEFLGVSNTAIRQRLTRARAELKEGMLAMMSRMYEQKSLPASFTFRIVETVKKIKIHPISEAKGLPWGLSLGAGLILAVLMLGQHIIISLPDIAIGLPLPSDTKILKVGEIPVEAVKVSTIASIADKGDGKGLAPDLKGAENAFFTAPQAVMGKWIKKSDMPNPRYWAYACEVNGKIYVIGGIKSFPFAVKTVEEYDPETETWKDKRDMPDTGGGSACVVNDKIYVIGGSKGLNQFLSRVVVYDPKLDKWEEKSDMPTPRSLHAVASVDGKIYAIGGWNNNGLLSAVEEYDPERDIWTKKANMPTPAQVCSFATANDKIYTMGKVYSQFWPMPRSPILEEYDPKTDTWTRKADMPTPRYYLASCELEGKVYAIGGIVDGINASSVVEIYDPVVDTWIKGKDMLTPCVST